MKFWVDFSGYMLIEANNEEEANTKFWDWVNSLNVIGDYSDDVWDVEGIEKKYEEAVAFIQEMEDKNE